MTQMRTKYLLASTAVTFLMALMVNHYQYKRSTDLVHGSAFLVGLDTDKIQSITLEEEGQKVEMELGESGFQLKNYGNYYTDTKKINDFLYRLSNITIDRKVSTSKELLKKYRVDDSYFRMKITLKDEEDKTISEFLLGEDFKGKGQYIKNVGKEDVYVTQTAFYGTAEKNSFISKDVLSFKAEEVQSVEARVKTEQYKVAKNDKGTWELISTKLKNFDAEKLKSFVNAFTAVNFNDFLTPTDPLNAKIRYANSYKVSLKSNITYLLQAAKHGGKHYVKVKATLANTPNAVTISKSDDKEKLKEVEATLLSRDQVNQFNTRHGGWTYEISEYKYQEWVKKISDFKSEKKIKNKKGKGKGPRKTASLQTS